jgi:hypothetical protein
MRELKNKEEDMLERAKRREARLREMGPARFPTVPAQSKKQVEFVVKLYDPAGNRSLPQPAFCTLCRAELDPDFIDADTGNGMIHLWKCGSCHNTFGILIGMYVNTKEKTVSSEGPSTNIKKKPIGRKVG